jgi:adenine/guanine/hypoxanthine permease
MEKLFKLKEHNTSVKTEMLAGLTTFLTMAYILIVNPLILKDAGMDFGGVFTATAISAAVATLIMAFAANLPFALAPGMGLNAFFAYTVVLGMGYSWQFALTAVFLEGLIFIVLTFFNVREAIVNCIPKNVKRAISVGIGLFIALIGLQNAGIVVADQATMVTVGNLTSAQVLVAVIGLVIMGVLLVFKIKGSLLIGIVAATIIALPLGVAQAPSGSWAPPSLAPVFLQFDFSQVFTLDMLIVLFTFLFVDMFDTVGTLIGVSTKAGLIDKDGNIPKVKGALFADAFGTTFGAILGTSTVTTYVESASGVAEGGRTGLASVATAVLFLLALFLSPLFLMVPGAATAPALVLVGLFMMGPIKNVDFEDYTEAIPAFLTMIMMPLTYSIAEGIMFGMLSYIVLKVFTGKAKEVSIITYIVGILFLIKYLM